MDTDNSSHIPRITALLHSAWTAPKSVGQAALALSYGVAVHLLFALGVGSMVVGMFFGMTLGLGALSYPWALLGNAFLIAQFAIAHSFLLSDHGKTVLAGLAPRGQAAALAPTVYALIAAVQLLVLFALWTPSGIIWWRADGTAFIAITILNGMCWLLLLKATYDAGIEVQSGALGWLTLAAGRTTPIYPDMPTGGLFRLVRQPIYVAFALTTWSVPVWTPDQLAIALLLTAYCLLAPRLKERRFKRRYGPRFDAYRAITPYAVPTFPRTTKRPS